MVLAAVSHPRMPSSNTLGRCGVCPSGRRRSGKGKGGKGVWRSWRGGWRRRWRRRREWGVAVEWWGGGGASGGSGGGGRGGWWRCSGEVVEVEAGGGCSGGGGWSWRGGSTQRVGSGGGQRLAAAAATHRETPSPSSFVSGTLLVGGVGVLARFCTYVLVPATARVSSVGVALHQRCYGRLTERWRHQFPDATEIPRWGELFRAGVAIFDLDYDAILAAMYAVTISDERDCYRTLLWHHALVPPPCLVFGGMASRVLVSGLPRSLPPLPPGPAPTCVPCVEGRAARCSSPSEFPDRGSAADASHGSVRAQPASVDRVTSVTSCGGDDYPRYITIFPLRRKGEVTEVLIAWIRAARLQLRESSGSDFPVLRLHPTKAESSPLTFCEPSVVHEASADFHASGLSTAKMGLLSAGIGMVMDVASYVYGPCGCPPFSVAVCGSVRGASDNLQPGSPCWRPPCVAVDGEGWAMRLRSVSGDLGRLFRDLSADKLSPRACSLRLPWLPPDAPGWQF
ncbi:unnamed protein product [Closterium sp. NIES-64]|nr:unnamed protein product [Closterium sp. NIES-64]